ncbi:uncharacterized protein [Aegilops tauschii subsp. strangulata]|uniref:uncharacterized protein n=1 Tax=Aegilops tauschii subsp. strangulata TaxID=200361 RepID=UPI003CC8C3BF
MDDFRNTTERLFIYADGNTKLEVLYTNEPYKVEEILPLYEEWLREDRYKFVGLDLEYTREDYFDRSRKVAVMQLAIREHVLVYHLCKARAECTALKDFHRKQGITFTSVDVRNDKDVLANSFLKIPRECHLDLQEELMIKGGNLRDSMADLAGAVIDKSYLSMKSSFPRGQHDYWECKPLSLDHLKYAAILRSLPPSSVDEGHDASSLSSRPQTPWMFLSRTPTE